MIGSPDRLVKGFFVMIVGALFSLAVTVPHIDVIVMHFVLKYW